MIFSDIENNDKIINDLRTAINNGSVHHAYIFEGPGSVDKKSFAKAFTKALLCQKEKGKGCGICDVCRKTQNENHIDVTFLEGTVAEGRHHKSVKDEGIEMLCSRLQKKPFEGDRNIAIICDADIMSARAANRLLKTLEEPPLGTVIMLLSENPEVLPKTILSRCVRCRVDGYEEGASPLKGKAEETVYMLVEKAPFYKLKKNIDFIGKDPDKAGEFLDCMEETYGELIRGKGCRSELFEKEYIYDAVSAIEKAKADIRKKTSVDYAVKKMILEIGG
jgi:DNA polymerase-3 subunit delta'